MMSYLRCFAVCFPLWSGCAHTRSLPTHSAEALHDALRETTADVERIYRGRVSQRNTPGSPLFHYERTVSDREDGLRSCHRTWTVGGEPVVFQQADHSADYELRAFEQIHGQSGLVGRVDVADDGTATFQTTVDGRTTTRVEAPGDPLHVGPTLFGYALEHWGSLVDGHTQSFRFAVVRKGRSYPFDLTHVPSEDGLTTFKMVASQPLTALAVPAAYLVFDSDRNIVRYEGLVPPFIEQGRRLKALNATVTYEHVSDGYR